MKTIITKNIAALFLAGALVIPTLAFAQIPAATGGGDSTITAASSGGQNQSTNIPAPTGGQNQSTNIPAPTGGQNQSTNIPAPTGGQNQSTAIPAPTGGQNESTVTPVQSPGTGGSNNGGNTNTGGNTTGGNTNTGGSNTSTGSSGSRPTSVGSSGGSISLPALTSTAQCVYLGSYILTNKVNNSADVLKLQSFLKNTEGFTVAQTGVYDAQTIAAVNAFQAKYSADVLAPWGVSTPTSQVYYTTSKKINEIFCKKTFSLTPAQIAEITRYRTSLQNGTRSTGTVGTSIGGTVVSPAPSTNDDGNPAGISTSTPDNSEVVGAASKAPVLSKIWNFIKRIFGR